MSNFKAKTDTWTPEAIAALRRKKHLSRPDLGELLGVNLSTVRNWETGRFGPTYRHLRALDRLEAAE